MYQINLIDGVNEPVGCITFQDQLRDEMRVLAISFIQSVLHSKLGNNAEIVYSKWGVNSRIYLTQYMIKHIQEEFDEHLDHVKAEVNRILHDKSNT